MRCVFMAEEDEMKNTLHKSNITQYMCLSNNQIAPTIHENWIKQVIWWWKSEPSQFLWLQSFSYSNTSKFCRVFSPDSSPLTRWRSLKEGWLSETMSKFMSGPLWNSLPFLEKSITSKLQQQNSTLNNICAFVIFTCLCFYILLFCITFDFLIFLFSFCAASWKQDSILSHVIYNLNIEWFKGFQPASEIISN